MPMSSLSAESSQRMPDHRRNGTAAAGLMTTRRSLGAGLDDPAQQAELVALGVGEHVPAHVALTDVDLRRAQCQQAFQLALLVAARRRDDVEVQSILDLLGF